MYHMEFMVLYLVEIVIAALVLIGACLLIRLVIFTSGLIGKIIRKGVKDICKKKNYSAGNGF